TATRLWRTGIFHIAVLFSIPWLQFVVFICGRAWAGVLTITHRLECTLRPFFCSPSHTLKHSIGFSQTSRTFKHCNHDIEGEPVVNRHSQQDQRQSLSSCERNIRWM
ncbi:hypothetical protein EDC04DRAFT_2680343, partial [Pisolithus marmoratus]